MSSALEELRLALPGYEPFDASELQHKIAFEELVRRDVDVALRDHFDPGHLTASAFIVNRERTHLLLHHHKRLDRWLQMGGHIDAGEKLTVAARREAQEESGLDSLMQVTDGFIDLDVHVIPAGRSEPAHRHYDVRYLFVAESGAPLLMQHEESNDLRWFELEEAERRMNEEASSRVIAKIRTVR